jgi:hypothetical protein
MTRQGTRFVRLLATIIPLAGLPLDAHAIPAFARRYRTTCASCHTAAPKLNSVGEAFRLNGYRLREFDEALGRDTGLPLGDEGWRDLWPEGIWPGEIPSATPISLRIQADVVSVPRGRPDAGLHFRFPRDVYLLSGASLGDGIAGFIEMEGNADEGIQVLQARLTFSQPIRRLPRGAFQLTVGRNNPYLFSFADRQIDRAAILPFGWQGYRVADLRLRTASGTDTLSSLNRARIGGLGSGFELHGILGGRFAYGVGVLQGADPGQDDNNDRKDAYARVRYKWGGLRLDGTYDDGGRPPVGSGGQRWDQSLILEAFAYGGEEPGTGARADRYMAAGVNARLLRGPLDLGVGTVVRRDDDPWGTGATAEMRSLFAKGEYFLWPWFAVSAKAEAFRARSDGARRAGYVRGAEDQLRFAPGVIALIRQNVRLAAEADLRGRDASLADAALRRGAAVTVRLDVAY